MAISKGVLIGSSLLVGGPAGAFGGYKYSETSVGYSLKGKILTEEATESWKALKEKLKKVTTDTNLREQLKKAKDEDGDSTEKLKTWCEQSYKQIYKTILGEDKQLFEDVKTYCGYTFLDGITDSKKLDDGALGTKVTSLKTGSDTINHENLKEIQTKAKAEGAKDEDIKKKLKEFCEQQYKEQYQGKHRSDVIKWCSKAN